jgi:hypothetical protein
VKQRPVGRSEVAGIIDQDHERDGKTAEKVKGEQAIGSLRRRMMGLSAGKLCLEVRTQGCAILISFEMSPLALSFGFDYKRFYPQLDKP